MLLSNVFLKSLRDRRLALIFWFLGICILSGLIVSLFPYISNNEALKEFADTMDPELTAVLGIQGLDYSTGAGYLNSEMFGFTVPILLLVFAIGLGSSSLAGEEDKRTIEVLLSEPLTRTRLLLEKYAALVTAMTMLGGMVWLSIAAGAAVVSMDLNILNLAAVTVSCALLAMVFGSISFGVGAATGKRGLSIAVGSATAAGTFVLNSLSALVDSMEPVKWISPFFYYSGNSPMINGLELLHVVLLLAWCGLAFALGYVAYQRRDLRL